MQAVLSASRRGTLRWSQVRAAYERLALGLLGVGVTLPLFLTPGQASGPRLGDLALAVAVPLVVVTWRDMAPVLRAAGVVAAGFLAMTLLVEVAPGGDRLNVGDAAFWFRWIASALAAPAVASLILRDEGRRRLFLWAVLAGAACHLATYGLAMLVGLEPLQDVGLASPRAMVTTTAAQVRVTTLAEHPNAAMAMIGLAVPAGMMLAERRWVRRGTTWGGVGVAVLGFVSTLSRGGMMAAMLGGLARMVVGWRWRWRERVRPLGVALTVFVLVAGAVALQAGRFDFDGGRFAGRFDRAALRDNLAGRMLTWRRTVDLVEERPMGAGWSSADEMGAFRALSVSHNGYLFTARTAGVVSALVLLGLHLASAARLDALTPLSVYVLAAMFGEDLTQGAGMVFLCCLVGALAWRRPLAP
ncbi:O-antigen ligase like membrane protein [Brevundimonas sp. 374]|nr:O-antigen ligase like membrane protein [Brevundimonas sp. 374]